MIMWVSRIMIFMQWEAFHVTLPFNHYVRLLLSQSSCQFHVYCYSGGHVSLSSSCRDLVDLVKKNRVLIFLDECHATGFLGETGRWVETGGTKVGQSIGSEVQF